MAHSRTHRWALTVSASLVTTWLLAPGMMLAQPSQPAGNQGNPPGNQASSANSNEPAANTPETPRVMGNANPFNAGVNDEPPPPEEIEWMALNKEYVDTRVATKVNQNAQVAVASKLVAYAEKYGPENKHFNELCDGLAPMYRNVDDLELLAEAFKQTERMLAVTGKLSKPELAEPRKTSIYGIQLSLQVMRAAVVKGAEKSQRYREALALIGVLLGRELALKDFRTIHETYGMVMWKLNRVDELLDKTKQMIDAEKDPERRVVVQLARVNWLDRAARWDDQIKFIETVENDLLDVKKRTAMITVMAAKAKAQMMLELDETYDAAVKSLRALGRDGAAAAEDIRIFGLRKPGTELPSFYLRDGVEDPQFHEIEEYFDHPTLYVLFRARSRDSVEFAREISRRVLSRYTPEQLNVLLVVDGRGGESAAEQQKALESVNWPRGKETILFDGRGVLANSLKVTQFPMAIFSDDQGKVLFTTNAVDTLSSPFGLYAQLEAKLELSEEGKAQVEETGDPENTPEYKMLQTLYDKAEIEKTHPARKAKTVKRALVLLGEDGRLQIRRRILSLLDEKISDEDRKTLRALSELLRQD